ncbi:MAG TPA: quinol:cytochrome C oxidoreductase [Ignavibacteria bacterium]|nr:quinol:cytochrome C oxidoreductase [Ignavibacteria bacterium]HMR38947.1 quinol:cytochrome C oxidoreductase [Ignavibacteria bacterium]
MDYQKKLLPAKVGTIGYGLLGIGALSIAISFAVDSHRAFFDYLWMYMFLVSIGVGSLALVALEYLVGATWSTPFRRVSEFLAALIPVIVVLTIPLMFGLHDLFHWSHPEAVAADPLLQAKEPYLNVQFFTVRVVIYLAIWLIFFYLFIRNSEKQDLTGDPSLTKQSIKFSAVFAILFLLTMAFASMDWMMSLEPHWYSTMFGVIYFAGTLLAAFGAATFCAVNLNEKGYFQKKLSNNHYYSFGVFMFAFVIFWAYLAFSQYMLIWYADIPEETFWIIMRMKNGWEYFSIGLIFFHFVLPFIILLPRSSKVNPKLLKIMAIWVVVSHAYDLYWIIMPTYFKEFTFGWSELGVMLFAAGLMITVFKYRADRKNLVPVKDPKLQAGLDYHLT